jgi:hypothetical protein
LKKYIYILLRENKEAMKKALKIVGISLTAVVVLSMAGFFIWAKNPSKAREVALSALQSDERVKVVETHDYILFEPVVEKAMVGFIFYPGGHVEFRSYAPILHKIAAEGFLVILVRVKLDLAFFDVEAGAPFLRQFPEIRVWTTGGHSLGGVASAWFAAKHPEIKAVVFWASYPADDALLGRDIKMLSIYGTEDGGLDNGKKIEMYKKYQPKDTVFYEIKGANHGQFADYGPQPGDKPATISQAEQFDITARLTADFFRQWKE